MYAARTIAETRQWLKESGPVDAVLMDMDLPDGNGLDFLPELNVLTGGAPVLVLSGWRAGEAAGRALERGAAGYMKKPYRMDELCHRMDALLYPEAEPVGRENDPHPSGDKTPRG